MSNVVIIYHNADPDGIFSGAIALKANPGALTIGYNYEKDVSHIIEQCKDKRVVMVDVSFSNWLDMHTLCEVADKVTWIDHHASAYRQMEMAGEVGTIDLYDNFECVFEHEKWGAAKKTWEYFFPESRLPQSIEFVAAYDVFREYGSINWKSFYFPFRFVSGMLRTPQEVLDRFHFDYGSEDDYNQVKWFLRKGEAIAEYVDSENEFVVNNPTLCFATFFVCPEKTYQVLAVNKPLMGDMFKSRDLGDFDFVAGFFCHATEWKVSLRGTGKDIDLGTIAKTFGGGGHKDAAGFSAPSFFALQKILLIK